MRPEKPNVENGVFFFPPPTLFLAHVHSRREGNEVERWSPLCVGRKGVGVLLFFFFPFFAFFFVQARRLLFGGATVCLLLSLPFNEHLHIKLNDYSSFFVFFQQALTFRVKKKGEKKKEEEEAMTKTKRGRKIAHAMSVSLKPQFKDVRVDSIDSSFVNQKKKRKQVKRYVTKKKNESQRADIECK